MPPDRRGRPTTSLYRTSTARCRYRMSKRASGGSGGRLSGRRFWSASATWTRATGAPTWQAGAQFKYGLLWVVGLASLMAIFMQVISARLGVVTGKDLAQCCRDWYPRWTRWPNWLFCETGHRRLRPGRSAGQRRRHQPAVSHPAALGGHHHRPSTCSCCWRLQRFGMRTIEAVVLRARRHDRRLLLHRDLRPAADAAELSRKWAGALLTPGLPPGRHDLRRHRHHRRDGHAAQSVPALGARAEPQAAKGRTRPSAAPSASTPSTRPSRWPSRSW